MARLKLSLFVTAILILSVATQASSSTENWRAYGIESFSVNGSPAYTNIKYLELHDDGGFELMRGLAPSDEGWWEYPGENGDLLLHYYNNYEGNPEEGAVSGDGSFGRVIFVWGPDSEKKRLEMCIVPGIDFPGPERSCD